MDTISFKGEKYIKAGIIAKELGYTPDYVGQLCRGGQVLATLVGRSWYVSENSIRQHKKSRYRSNFSKSHTALKREISERLTPPPRYLKNSAEPVYEPDEEPLMPVVSKELQTNVVSTSVNEIPQSNQPESLREDLSRRVVFEAVKETKRPPVRIISAAANRPTLPLRPKVPIRPLPSPHKPTEGPSWILLWPLLLCGGILFTFVMLAFEKQSTVSLDNGLKNESYYEFDPGEALEALKKLME